MPSKPPAATVAPPSPDRSPLDIDLSAPICLQRLRPLLELLYHSTLTSLCHPFTRLAPFCARSTPASDSHATSALDYAIAVTNMLHQTLSETDVLAGWHRRPVSSSGMPHCHHWGLRPHTRHVRARRAR
jgi:hypothetical protein